MSALKATRNDRTRKQDPISKTKLMIWIFVWAVIVLVFYLHYSLMLEQDTQVIFFK